MPHREPLSQLITRDPQALMTRAGVGHTGIIIVTQHAQVAVDDEWVHCYIGTKRQMIVCFGQNRLGHHTESFRRILHRIAKFARKSELRNRVHQFGSAPRAKANVSECVRVEMRNHDCQLNS
ncbi:MAG: hypothetical protein JWM11_8131 [Planctomycetaceae bacterium]|nr:hypothetical protein [Planctomycetaceae bacterium]